jgi:Flp pilus assembly protein TadG
MADRARYHRQLLARLGLGRSGLGRRFARADDGAAAIKFAFVGIPFLILVFGLIELGLTFLVSMTLENALMTVDRRIRTGDYKSISQDDFSKAVCDEMSWLESSCADSITLDVRVLPAFEKAKTLKPPEGVPCFDPGGPRSIMLVRAYYKWPIITPLLQSAVAGGSGVRQVTFASVFVNEPYSPNLEPIKCQ